MNYIKKFAWGGTTVALAALLAFAMLVAPSGSTVHAANEALSASTVVAGSTINLTGDGLTGATNEIQTISASGGGGTFDLNVPRPGGGAAVVVAAQACDTSSADLETAINAALNTAVGAPSTGTWVATGGGALDAAPVTITYNYGGNVALATITNETCTGTPAVTETTPGANATQLVVASINAAQSNGTAEFQDGAGDRQSTALLDNSALDQNPLNTVYSARIRGLTAGTVVVNVTVGGTTTNLGFLVTGGPTGATVVANPTAINASAPNNTTVLTATGSTATGAVPDGTVVTFTTTLGNLTNCSQSTDGLQQCTELVSGGNGQATVTLNGAGVTGTATVTARFGPPGGPTATTTVVVSGPQANVAISLTSSSIASAPGNNSYAVVTVTDSGGNPVSGATPTVTVTSPATAQVATDGTNATIAAAPAGTFPATPTMLGCAEGGTNAAGQCATRLQTQAGNQPGLQTIRARIVVAGNNVDATAELRLAKALSSVSVSVGSVEPAGTATVTISAVDEDGNPAADTTAAAPGVVGAASAGAIVNCSRVVNGEATCTFVAPTSPQVVTVTAVVTIGPVTRQGSTQVNVGTPPPPDTEGEFSTPPTATGLTITSYTGSLAAFQADGAALDLVSGFATVDGSFVGYIFGAPAFVNAGFTAEFAAGLDNVGLICRR